MAMGPSKLAVEPDNQLQPSAGVQGRAVLAGEGARLPASANSHAQRAKLAALTHAGLSPRVRGVLQQT